MIVEIISLIIGLIVGCCVWVLKGEGTIRGYILFIFLFVFGNLAIVVGFDHFGRWREARTEKKELLNTLYQEHINSTQKEFSEMTEEEHRESLKERLKNISENYETKNNGYTEIMKIYLDIDGVLITSDGSPTPYVYELLSHCVSSHECFWLTTHCRFNDPENAVSYLSDKLSDKCLPLLKQIKGTEWDILKTDAIDFSSDFLWLDDYLMQSEEKVLEEHNAQEKHILIELKKNPEQLKEVLEKITT